MNNPFHDFKLKKNHTLILIALFVKGPMNENEVIKTIEDFISRKFPKDCNCCGKRYNTLSEYLRNTKHVGKPTSFDAEDENWKPVKPIGTISLSNCSCGTTLSISSKGMNLITMWRLMNWARKEKKARGVEIDDLLEDIREKIDKSVLQSDR